MVKLHFFQHVPFEDLASIGDWAKTHGHPVTRTAFFLDEPVPALDSFDWLIVMGGPMSTSDEAAYPWLVREKQAIRQAITHGKRVLGICLGAQLIAEMLGGQVYPNPQKEIGWFPIELTGVGKRSSLFGFLPPRLDVFHWHGDTFDLPPGAVHIARSDACANQAFVYGARVVGLQFHMEVTPASAAALIQNCAGELVAAPHIQGAEEMLAHSDDFSRLNGYMNELLNRLHAAS